MILCYGDSITQGVPGVSYLNFIGRKWKLRNLGRGGETVIGLGKRIPSGLKKYNSNNCIVQIGTNDILLPHLLQHSEQWRTRVKALIDGGRVPCEDASEFEEKYTNLTAMFMERGKNLMVVNIPCIGEDLSSPVNTKVDEYNKVLKAVAAKHGLPHIDFNGWQKEVLAEKKQPGEFFITRNPFDMVLDSVTTSILPVSDYLSRKRGLHLTIDGCHLNSSGAKGLASLVEEKLRAQYEE